MHTCSHLIHTIQFVCVHCSSLTHINTPTHTHIHTSVYLAALFNLAGWKMITTSHLSTREKTPAFSFCSLERREQLRHCPPWRPAHTLGRRGQTTFFSSPRLLFAGPRACAVHSHLPSGGALFGGESVSLSVVGHCGTVGALDGRREVVRSGAGLRGGSRRLCCCRTVDFIALGVALWCRAGVDAIRVALGGRLGRPPTLPCGFYQILQGDGSSLHRHIQR